MLERPDIVLGRESLPAEDELRLPKPPGVFRQFWARHPLGTDILIAVVALLISVPAVIARSSLPEPIDPWMTGTGIALALLGCVGAGVAATLAADGLRDHARFRAWSWTPRSRRR